MQALADASIVKIVTRNRRQEAVLHKSTLFSGLGFIGKRLFRKFGFSAACRRTMERIVSIRRVSSNRDSGKALRTVTDSDSR